MHYKIADGICGEQMAKRADKAGTVHSRLSRLMGEKRVRIVELARATGISRNMIAMLYYDRAQRIDLADIAKLCNFFGCELADLFELQRSRGGQSS